MPLNVNVNLRQDHHTTSPTIYEQCVGYLTDVPKKFLYVKGLWDGVYSLKSLSGGTRKSNPLQIALQKQHFHPSYSKTPNVVSCSQFSFPPPLDLTFPALPL